MCSSTAPAMRLSTFGLGADYVKRTNCSFFTLEAHVTYLRELHAAIRSWSRSQFLDYDAKRIHYVEEMCHAHGGWIACISEHIVIHVDMTHEIAPFPPDVLDNIKAMHAAHALCRFRRRSATNSAFRKNSCFATFSCAFPFDCHGLQGRLTFREARRCKLSKSWTMHVNFMKCAARRAVLEAAQRARACEAKGDT